MSSKADSQKSESSLDQKSSSAQLDQAVAQLRRQKSSVNVRRTSTKSSHEGLRARKKPTGSDGAKKSYKYARKSSSKSDANDGYGYPYTKSSGYKNKHQKEDWDYFRFKKEDKACPPVFWLVLAIIGLILLAVALTGTVFLWDLSLPSDKINQTRIVSREVPRKRLAILSDNLDCSILMKRQILQDLFLPLVLINSFMCLHMMEPHSVAPDSALSFLFYFNQGPKSLARSQEMGFMNNWRECFSFDPKVKLNNTHCDPRTFHRILTSFSTHSEHKRIADSAMQSHVVFNWREIYYKAYGTLFQRFARFNDSGEQPLYPEVYNTFDYNTTEQKEIALHRVLPVSKQFAAMVEEYKTKIPEWNANIFGKKDRKPVKYADKVTVTKNNTRYLINEFLYSNKSRAPLRERYHKAILSIDEYTDYHIIYPKGQQTSSVISAFIVKVVYDALANVTMDASEIEREAMFYSHLLAAQKYAYQLLPKSKEWNRKKNKKNLMAFTNVVMNKFEKGEFDAKIADEEIVTRPDADRVISQIAWKHQDGDFLSVINLGLPRPFDSSYVTGKQKKARFASFSSKSAGQSAPFTSSASLFVLRSPRKAALFSNQYLIATATASGSIRTIEAVATPILRHLLFKEESGAAIAAPSLYVSLLDGSVRCEKERYIHGKQFRLIEEVMKQKYGISCEHVNKEEFKERDRMAMMVTRGKKEEDWMKAAIDERGLGHNYATGY